MMKDTMSKVIFPVGAHLADGRYVVRERVRGAAARGMFRAVSEGESGTFLVTVGTKQRPSAEELTAALALSVPGISELRHIGPVSERERDYDGMVEDEPSGQPSSALAAPLVPRVALELALGVCPILRSAHAAGAVVRHLRPELIYVTTAGDRVTGLVPRGEEFLRTAIPPSYGVPPMFDTIFIAPEVSAKREVKPVADVFALAGVLAYWLTAEHPFLGNDPGQQILAMHADKRRPWGGPAGMGALVARGLTIKPADRPSLDRFEADLRAALPS